MPGGCRFASVYDSEHPHGDTLIFVSSLFTYPVKSCQGLSLREMPCGERGPVGDRHYMIVDDRGRFLSQRDSPRLTLVAPEFQDETLVLHAPGMRPLPLDEPGSNRKSVRVWSFEGEALDMGDACAEWFRAVLERDCRLVRFADDVHRRVGTDAASAEVGFADGYPFLVVSLESLSELNRRLQVPLPMNRFRPNVVLRGCQPFQEDEWDVVSFPELSMQLMGPSPRCKMTTLDPETLEYGKEPLRTLAKFRKQQGGVMFGQNAIHLHSGCIRVGDPVTVERERTREVEGT